jgi:deoxyadenosine/deoxycytidine kinase
LQGLKHNGLAQKWKNAVCIDYTIYEHIDVYGKALLEQGSLEKAEFGLVEQLFEAIEDRIMKPDLLIYVKADLQTLQKRILHRGRPFEKKIDTSYLKTLQKYFDLMIERWTRCPIFKVDSSVKNFLDRAEMSELAEAINRTLIKQSKTKH